MHCDHGTVDSNDAWMKWEKTTGVAFASTGKGDVTLEGMKTRMKDAGFVNVQQKVYKVPFGNWTKNPVLKEAGKYMKHQFMEGMERFAKYTLTKVCMTPKVEGRDIDLSTLVGH